jgi:hypothetical protein
MAMAASECFAHFWMEDLAREWHFTGTGEAASVCRARQQLTRMGSSVVHKIVARWFRIWEQMQCFSTAWTQARGHSRPPIRQWFKWQRDSVPAISHFILMADSDMCLVSCNR